MHKFISNLRDIISQTAEDKRKAAAARFGNVPCGGEKPRDVYLKACEMVASAFTGDGYKYLKSGPKFVRRACDLTFWVAFQSSHNNVANQRIALWVHAGVSSGEMKIWREKNAKPPNSSDHITAGQIGNLMPKRGWLDWDLAEQSSRLPVLKDVERTIRDVAFSHFALFEDIPSLVSRMGRESVPGFTLAISEIEFVLCFGTKSDAEQVLRRFLQERHDLLPDYLKELERFRKGGLPKIPLQTLFAYQLAFATLAYELQPDVEP